MLPHTWIFCVYVGGGGIRKVTVPFKMPDKSLSLRGENIDTPEYSIGLPRWY